MTDFAPPGWLAPLVAAARSAGPGDFPAFTPPPGGGRDAAVLIALRDGTDGTDGPAVLLIRRASSLRKHPGQVAFPGGAADPGEDDPRVTALREAREEVGLDPVTVRPVARLPDLFLPPSGFVVAPVLAWWERPGPVWAVDPAEVSDVTVLPLAALADPAHRFRARHPSGRSGPAFRVGHWLVWGFTAGLLDVVLRLGGWAQPWDESRTENLPYWALAPSTGGPGTG